jgi:hypothetical protein
MEETTLWSNGVVESWSSGMKRMIQFCPTLQYSNTPVARIIAKSNSVSQLLEIS